MRVLIDSDCLFALFIAHDPHHVMARKLFKSMSDINAELMVTNAVIQETATVLSYKIGQKESLDFLDRFSSLKIAKLTISDGVEEQALKIFKQQTKKGISFVDCANMAVLEEYKFDGILSFDRFYKDKLII
jgi:predicted nucleic acid-binding protein